LRITYGLRLNPVVNQIYLERESILVETNEFKESGIRKSLSNSSKLDELNQKVKPKIGV
jgi:hypothetical protein